MMRAIKIFSIKVSLIFFPCLSIIACASSAAKAEFPKEILGEWIIESIIQTDAIQGPSLSQQQKLLGSTIEYKENSMKSCWSDPVPITNYEKKKLNANDFLSENKIPLGSLRIQQDIVSEITLNNRQAGTCFEDFPLPGQVIFIKNEVEMIVAFEGVYYLVRKNNPVTKGTE